MKKASYIGTIPLDFLVMPDSVKAWESYETEDIFTKNFITIPNNYLYTTGSGIVFKNYQSIYTSLATTPNFQLPTTSQFYVAGRDVIRWGGENDPLELDFDRYGFTPDFNKGVAVMWKAPKSEPHHLSEVPSLINNVPENLKEVVEAITEGKYKKRI